MSCGYRPAWRRGTRTRYGPGHGGGRLPTRWWRCVVDRSTLLIWPLRQSLTLTFPDGDSLPCYFVRWTHVMGAGWTHAAHETVHAGKAYCGAGTVHKGSQYVAGDWAFVTCKRCERLKDQKNQREGA